ncbi:hypothetical protein EDB86DRAFT_1823012 [Lactarius hatsudake]|nr:hypothetical protein EDB86DRAFT_1823012 [Lactarius hatsudake]
MLPQGPGQPHDGANASQLGPLVHPGDAFQSPPAEVVKSADPALDVQAVETPGGGEGGALPFCETCALEFGRPQEFKRHMEQVHQPQRQCPFNPCAYGWKRPDKIKAHIIDKHRSELCPEVFKNVSALRGKRIVEFIDAYEFGRNFRTPAEPWVLLSLPPLAGSENFMLRCVFLRTNK